MSDTLGSLVDKLITVDMKMWDNQEILYEIRRISLKEFKDKYYSEEGMELLFKYLKKACDLNIQRNNIIDEIDETIVKMLSEKNLDKYIQRKHKTL